MYTFALRKTYLCQNLLWISRIFQSIHSWENSLLGAEDDLFQKYGVALKPIYLLSNKREHVNMAGCRDYM